MTKKNVTKITAGPIISWLGGLFFVLLGIGYTGIGKPFSGALFVIGAILIIPITNKFIQEKFNIEISGGLKVLIFFAFLLLIPFISAMVSVASYQDSSNSRSTAVASDYSSPLSKQTPDATSQITKTLSGYGTEATETFYLKRGLARFKMSYSGSRSFIVWLMDNTGNKKELLAADIGPFDGSKAVRISESGYYLIDVDTIGSWTIYIS